LGITNVNELNTRGQSSANGLTCVSVLGKNPLPRWANLRFLRNECERAINLRILLRNHS
jgi:hypothetical protein